MPLKVHLIRFAACLSAAALAGFLASVLSVRLTDPPPSPDLSSMDQSLDLTTQLVLNRAELTLRTVDLQSLLIQEATSGQCSSGARFLLRQAMIENAVVRYAALMRDGRLSCQPGQEDEAVLETAVQQATSEADLILIDPTRSGRAGEVALIRFKDEGFASVFWFPVDRLLADPLKESFAGDVEVRLLSPAGVTLVRAGAELPPGQLARGREAQSSTYPIKATVFAPELLVSQASQPSPLWPIGSAIFAALLPLLWRSKPSKSET